MLLLQRGRQRLEHGAGQRAGQLLALVRVRDGAEDGAEQALPEHALGGLGGAERAEAAAAAAAPASAHAVVVVLVGRLLRGRGVRVRAEAEEEV